MTKFAESMARIGMEPFIAAHNVSIGSDLSSKVKENIQESNCFVPFLTKNSVSSQWVNQEIGYAIGTSHELGIYPVVEKGLEIKGFINKSKENLELDPADIDQAIYHLVAALRGYINRNMAALYKILIRCPKCDVVYSRDLPTQMSIDEAALNQKVIPAKCTTCGVLNYLDPRTYKVNDSTKILS